MIIKLGVIAGDILTFLENCNCCLKVDSLVEKMEQPGPLVLMSVGWLVREGYLDLETKEDELYVALKPHNGEPSGQ